MNKFFNLIMFLLISLFIFFIFNHYLSNKNINAKKHNRLNIDEILLKKINNLPIIYSDTNNVIIFNNSLENETNNEKRRSFWDLLKN